MYNITDNHVDFFKSEMKEDPKQKAAVLSLLRISKMASMISIWRLGYKKILIPKAAMNLISSMHWGSITRDGVLCNAGVAMIALFLFRYGPLSWKGPTKNLPTSPFALRRIPWDFTFYCVKGQHWLSEMSWVALADCSTTTKMMMLIPRRIHCDNAKLREKTSVILV